MDMLKRIIALTGVAILLLCYVMSFVTAVTATPEAHNWFIASIGATILIPTVLYGYSIIAKTTNRNQQESNLREDAYLRLMKEQMKKKQEENAENTQVQSVEQQSVVNQNAGQQNVVNQNVDNPNLESHKAEGWNTNGQQ